MMRVLLPVMLMLTWSLFGAGHLEAGARPEVVKARYVNSPPKIDGEIDRVYSTFEKIDEFYQLETGWGKRATEKTEAFLGYDDKNLYFAIKCYDTEPSGIRGNIERRDNFGNSDYIIIFLDTFKTGRKAILLGFNPYGVQLDGTRDDEAEQKIDFSWDTLWYSRGKIYDWGYFVESRIPFKSLRFPRMDGKQEWGLLVIRSMARKGEECTSVEIDPNIRGLISQQSMLVIDREIQPSNNFEAIPTLVGVKHPDEKLKPEFGVSLKYGITSNSTADFTYNPDFSHIEADATQIDINQRFALYYDEKRPFFLESKEIFDMPMQLFYSRRISDPAWGLKFTGRFGQSGIGFISAKDTASFEDLDDVTNGGEDTAFLNVLRYKYQFKGAGHVGIFCSNKSWNGKNNLALAADTFLKKGNLAFKFQGAYTDKEEDEGSALFSSLSYQGKHLQSEVRYSQFSPDFDPQVGFINRVGYRSLEVSTGYQVYPQKPYLRRFKPYLKVTHNFDWGSKDVVDRIFSLGVNAQAYKNSYLVLQGSKSMEQFMGIEFEKFRFLASYSINLTKAFSFDTNFQFGDDINYWASKPYLGYSYSFKFSGNFNLWKRVSLNLGYSNYYLYDRPGGALDLKMNIFRVRNTVFLTREVFCRLIYEYDDYVKDHYISWLLSYELNPGTVFYLGLSSDFIKNGDSFQQENFSVFFKFSYFLRM